MNRQVVGQGEYQNLLYATNNFERDCDTSASVMLLMEAVGTRGDGILMSDKEYSQAYQVASALYDEAREVMEDMLCAITWKEGATSMATWEHRQKQWQLDALRSANTKIDEQLETISQVGEAAFMKTMTVLAAGC